VAFEPEHHPMTNSRSKRSIKSASQKAGRARQKGSAATKQAPTSKGRIVAEALTKLGTRKDQGKPSKTETCLELLRRRDGATIEELQKATGWQAHSVRGFMSGMVKKKLGLTLASEKPKDGTRRYRIVQAGS
jgi:hypothetical protein